MLHKERKSEFGKLSKVKESIVKLMVNKNNVNKVENEFNRYTELCEKIQQVHTSLLGFLPADEANKHEIWYQAKLLNVNEFIVNTNQWLSDTKTCPASKAGGNHDNDLLNQTEQTQTVQSETEIEPAETHMVVHNTLLSGNDPLTDDVNNGNGADVGMDEEHQIQPKDSISNVQSRHHGSDSRSSSSRSSTSSARRKAEAEQAALLARAGALKDKHALEEQELILKKKESSLS